MNREGGTVGRVLLCTMHCNVFLPTAALSDYGKIYDYKLSDKDKKYPKLYKTQQSTKISKWSKSFSHSLSEKLLFNFHRCYK